MMTNMIRADTLCVGPSNSEFTIFTMHQFREDGFNLIGIVWNRCQEIEDVQPGMKHWATGPGYISSRRRWKPGW